jgi:hypothetical protein
MQASPPDTTDTWSPKAVATAPASRSPSRGPPWTTPIWMAASRPCSRSGTDSWMIVFRSTAEMTSAQPAMARNSRASSRFLVTPNPTMAAPQTMTAAVTARPCRRRWEIQPVVSAPTSAPAPGAAYRNPSTAAPPPNTLAAMAGNSARGMPKTMALTSIR